MCGIAGELVMRGGRPLSPDELLPMIDVLSNRGPESAGYWHDEKQRILMMHARLALVDIPGGAQPMAHEGGRIWVSINGELYDFRRIRRRLLQAGHRLRSECDVEILPYLFEEEGEDCFSNLRGEFAIALWDDREETLYLARDHFGTKPLFYAKTSDSLVFGSEVKALLCHPSISAEFDAESIHQSLHALGVSDRSWFRDIRQVRPGHFLKVKGERIEEVCFFRHGFTEERHGIAPEEAEEEFRTLFDEAVRLRMDADVEIGVMLSGGLDSATALESMSRQSGRPIKTFSIRFSQEADREADKARQVATAFEAENTAVMVNAEKLAEAFLPALWACERAMVNSHCAAKFLLSREAGGTLKSFLTGNGADEVFLGYPSAVQQHLIEASRAGDGDRQGLRRLLGTESAKVDLVPRTKYPRHDFVRSIYGCYPMQVAHALEIDKTLRPFFTRGFAGQLSLEDCLRQHAQGLPAGPMEAMPPVRASQYAWNKSQLPDYLLPSLGDRVETGLSVEGRTPFFDQDLARFAMSLPVTLLVNGTNGKLIVRNAMKGRLPPDVTDPGKALFWSPVAHEKQLLETPLLRHYLSPAVTRDVGIYNPMLLGMAHRLNRVMPPRGRIGASLRMLLITAASTHAVHDLFIKDFHGSVAKFRTRRARWHSGDLLRQGARAA